jgi:hypothetical protein
MTTLFGKELKNLALSAALLMLLSARVDAAVTTWDLSNVFFDDGTQATGSLTFDSFGSNVFNLSSWDVSVAHDGSFFQFTFNPADSNFTFTTAANLMDPEVDLFTGVFDDTFAIVLAGFTLPATGTLDLATKASPFVDGHGFHYSSLEGVNPSVHVFIQRFVVSGSLVEESTSAPEPSTWILAGGVLLSLAARKRKSSGKLC